MLIGHHGAKNWSEIAANIKGRSGKSCRLRWCNQLNPTVKKEPFNNWEDAVIIRSHELHGNKWASECWEMGQSACPSRRQRTFPARPRARPRRAAAPPPAPQSSPSSCPGAPTTR
jgi:hypothetical protein